MSEREFAAPNAKHHNSNQRMTEGNTGGITMKIIPYNKKTEGVLNSLPLGASLQIAVTRNIPQPSLLVVALDRGHFAMRLNVDDEQQDKVLRGRDASYDRWEIACDTDHVINAIHRRAHLICSPMDNMLGTPFPWDRQTPVAGINEL